MPRRSFLEPRRRDAWSPGQPDEVEFQTAGPDHSAGIMVCCTPTPNECAAMAMPDGAPVDDMHCTLGYFGTVDEAPDGLAEALTAVCQEAANAVAGPLVGTVSGVAVFDANPERPLVALPDVPGLDRLRTAMVDAAGNNPPALDALAQNHGFTPHITLGYDPTPEEHAAAVDVATGQPVTFASVVLVYGDETTAFDMNEVGSRDSSSDALSLEPDPETPPAAVPVGMAIDLLTEALARQTDADVALLHVSPDTLRHGLQPTAVRPQGYPQAGGNYTPVVRTFANGAPLTIAETARLRGALNDRHRAATGAVLATTVDVDRLAADWLNENHPEHETPDQLRERAAAFAAHRLHHQPSPELVDQIARLRSIGLVAGWSIIGESWAASGIAEDRHPSPAWKPPSLAALVRHDPDEDTLDEAAGTSQGQAIVGGAEAQADRIHHDTADLLVGPLVAAVGTGIAIVALAAALAEARSGGTRIDRVVDTETVIGQTAGSHMFGQAAGSDLYTWELDPSLNNCEDCAELADLAPATLSEWSASGNESPLHPGCGCIMMPSPPEPDDTASEMAMRPKSRRPRATAPPVVPLADVVLTVETGEVRPEYAIRDGKLVATGARVEMLAGGNVLGYGRVALADDGAYEPQLVRGVFLHPQWADVAPTTTPADDAPLDGGGDSFDLGDVVVLEDGTVCAVVDVMTDGTCSGPDGGPLEATPQAPVYVCAVLEVADDGTPTVTDQTFGATADMLTLYADEAEPNGDADDMALTDVTPSTVVPPNQPIGPPAPRNLDGIDPRIAPAMAARAQAGDFDWEGVICEEEVETGDQRYILADALGWRLLPHTFMVMLQNPESGGHALAIPAGSTWAIGRAELAIWAKGFFDSGFGGREARRMMEEGTLKGSSVDLSAMVAEVWENDETGALRFTVVSAQIMGHTLCNFPAMDEGILYLCDIGSDQVSPIVASGRPVWGMDGQHWTIDEDRTERLGGARPSEAEQARLSFSTSAGDVFEAWAVNAADLPAPDAGPGVHPRSNGSVTMSLTIDPGQALDATALVSGIESGLASAGLTKADDGWHVAQTTDPRVAAVAARYRSGLAVPVARPARIRKGDT